MALPLVTRYVHLRRMNAPRTELCMEQIRQFARELDDATLFELTQRVFVASRKVSRLVTLRKVQSEGRGEGQDDRFDTDADDAARPLIKALVDAEEYMIRTRHPDAERVRRLRKVHFPTGPSDIISQRYEEQLHRTRALVADLRGPYAELLPELEVERKLQRVEALIEPYARALEAREKVTATDVRLAALEMHERTCVVVAYVVARWYDEPEVVGKLLLPIVDQQDRIAAILKARRSGQSMDDDPSRDEDDLLAEADERDTIDEPLDDDAPIVDVPDDAAAGDGDPDDAAEAPGFPGVIDIPRPGEGIGELPGGDDDGER